MKLTIEVKIFLANLVAAAILIMASWIAVAGIYFQLSRILRKLEQTGSIIAERLSISNTLILYVYLLHALSVFFLTVLYFKYKKYDAARKVIVVLILMAVLPAVFFWYMNISGQVCEYVKEEGCIPLFKNLYIFGVYFGSR